MLDDATCAEKSAKVFSIKLSLGASRATNEGEANEMMVDPQQISSTETAKDDDGVRKSRIRDQIDSSIVAKIENRTQG